MRAYFYFLFTREFPFLGDVEDSGTTPGKYVYWSKSASGMLISLYEEHEDDCDNPRKKKKDVWREITKKLNDAGYEFTQLKVENKWLSLVQSYKDIKDSKKKTGEKRKTFQYHERLENILSKRHDIQPPFTSSSLDNNEEDKTSTSSEESKSSSISAVKRRGKRKQATNNDTVIQALKDIEKIRKLERDEREKKREERAQERNALLREFLNILKEK